MDLLGERWTVDQIRMQFAGRHEGYLTRTCVHRLHVDANLVAIGLQVCGRCCFCSCCSCCFCYFFLLSPIPGWKPCPPLFSTQKGVASRTITSLDDDSKMNAPGARR